MAISHCSWHLVVKNGNCTSWDIYYRMYLAAILDSSRKGGNFIQFWIIRLVNSQLALYSHVRCKPLTPLDIPWHPKIPLKHPHMTITNFTYESFLHCYWHLVSRKAIGRSASRSNNPQPWHIVVKYGNFTLLLTSSDQEWQFHTATDILWLGMAISHLGICIMGCIWQTVWILQEKVGISFNSE